MTDFTLLQLTRAMCCPTSDGAACAIIASEDFVIKHGLQNQAVRSSHSVPRAHLAECCIPQIEIVGQAVATDSVRLFDDRSAIELTGVRVSHSSARNLADGVSPGRHDEGFREGSLQGGRNHCC